MWKIKNNNIAFPTFIMACIDVVISTSILFFSGLLAQDDLFLEGLEVNIISLNIGLK